MLGVWVASQERCCASPPEVQGELPGRVETSEVLCQIQQKVKKVEKVPKWTSEEEGRRSAISVFSVKNRGKMSASEEVWHFCVLKSSNHAKVPPGLDWTGGPS